MTVKLDHINISTENLNESIEWYKKIFGFELVESGIKPNGTRWGIIALNDSMICMGEYPGRELANKIDDRSVHQIYHFGIRVSDLEKWKQIMKNHNLKPNYGGPVEYPNSKSWYIYDPSGHEIEVSYTALEKMPFPSRGHL
jgi:lactoylglutathione lyase